MRGFAGGGGTSGSTGFVGMPNVRVDGNDVIGSYAVTREAMDRARSGGGPSFIEAFTYRMGAHTTSDDPTRYRSKADEEYWAERDPIARLEAYLERSGALSPEYREETAEIAKTLAADVRVRTKAAEKPPTHEMFDHVFAEPHATVDADRAWFERFERSFVDSEGRH